jgi:integrase
MATHPTKIAAKMKDRGPKPEKPTADFPLFAHACGSWAKKINGKLHFFGGWSDPDAALKRYKAERKDRENGLTPRQATEDQTTLRQLCNKFMNVKKRAVEIGELSLRSHGDYYRVCRRLVKAFGKDRLLNDILPEDLEKLRHRLAKKMGPVGLANELTRTRTVLKYAYDVGLIDRPIRYNIPLKKPSRKTIRKDRAKKGVRMFTKDQFHKILEAATPIQTAMILLGINCGFGNADIGRLPIKALDLKHGWVEFPRPKTGIPRRCKLLPDTVAALRAAIKARPTPKNPAHRGLVFVTKYGKPWFRDVSDSPLSAEFKKLLKDLGIYRPGLGFYSLRHATETIGGESRDQAAVDHVMGHTRDDMASNYREAISDERLEAVADRIGEWMKPEEKK